MVLNVCSLPGHSSTAIIESAERTKEETVGIALKGDEREAIPMPGVIMDSGDRNGSHTNHDRDSRPNGVNGGSFSTEKAPDKGKGREPQQNMTPTSPSAPNILNGMANSQHDARDGDVIPQDIRDRLNQLPPEIAHITQGYMPLATLLTRMAQKTHNDLTNKILEMAQMPVPASTVNGNASHTSSVDDNSADNVNKKHRLLEFAQNTHADWAKAFVITSWSRHSEDVSKVIDLKVHLDQQRALYDNAIGSMAEVKRSLGHARVPNPDLKTAVQVLSTGKAPWMPEVRSGFWLSSKLLTRNSSITLNHRP